MYADVDGMRMYYEEHGNPDGPPLVLLHGFTLTGRLSWDPHLAAVGADYRLVVPDLRGHGLSDNPEGAAGMNGHRFAQDISRFCDQIGIERAAFFGYSMEATVVLHLALSRPDLVAAAVLAAASFTVPEPVRASMRDMSVFLSSRMVVRTPRRRGQIVIGASSSRRMPLSGPTTGRS